MRINSIVILGALFLWSCNNGRSGQKALSDCPYPVPVAIFSDTLPTVTQHKFTISAMEGVEEVTFANGMGLTLIQSGCEARKQEFQFRLPGQTFPENDPAFWTDQTIEQINYITNLGPQYLSLSAWAQAIDQVREQIILGEPTEIQPGFYVEVDRILSADHAILLLTLSETP